MIFNLERSVNTHIPLFSKHDIQLFVKREDKIHPVISGNKYRKLKYNILEAKKLGFKTLLTFGGAFSNHIAALASVGEEFGFKTIGIIRGEELEHKIMKNQTLSFAQECGMQFKFLTRENYRNKESELFLEELKNEFKVFYTIPEGGTNQLAIKGCEEILTEADSDFDYVCCSVGTGGTISGLINCSQPGQQVIGFSALKGGFLKDNISKFVTKANWKLITDYHFGGYAKINIELITFINQFKKENNIPLDPVYTGKMIFGIFDLIEKDYFPNGSKILAIHTGGLQGVSGMNTVLKKKDWQLIN